MSPFEMFTAGKMTQQDWTQVTRIPFKNSNNNYGEPDKMDRSVVMTLEIFSRVEKLDVMVTSGTGGTHAPGSFHYSGLAIDFMLPYKKRSQLPDVLLALMRYPFTGIGMYSEWSLEKGVPAIGGFHVDVRPVNRRALWLKTPEGYVGMTMKSILAHFR